MKIAKTIYISFQLVLLWAQLTKIYPPLPTSVQPISITKTLLIVPTKNERNPPLFTGKLLIKFQNILRNTTQVIIRHSHRVKILYSVISSPITNIYCVNTYTSKQQGIDIKNMNSFELQVVGIMCIMKEKSCEQNISRVMSYRLQEWVSDCCLMSNEQFSALFMTGTSYWTLRWDDDDKVCSVLDQQT